MTNKLPRIAAITTLYVPASHADVLVTKFLRGFPCDDGLHAPRTQIVSLYIDQIPERDMGVATAREFGVPVYDTVQAALLPNGQPVDGVLLVGEHGEYPTNELGQVMYPRRILFERIVKELTRQGRSVPLFGDKHLSYEWPGAAWMVQAARELRAPFMAGSSLPNCWRRPYLEHPVGVSLQAAASIAYGPIESYGFHMLETLQCMVERRRGGEVGIEAVRCLEGDAVWEWLDENPVHAELASAAGRSIRETTAPWERVREVVKEPAAFLLRYGDGLEAVNLLLNGYSQSFAYAAQTPDGIAACEFYLQAGMPYGHFSYLGRNIEEMFVTGRPTYPVERTLLTTGALAAAMQSRHDGHIWMNTPHLSVAYAPSEIVPYRPMGPQPSGATVAPWPPAR